MRPTFLQTSAIAAILLASCVGISYAQTIGLAKPKGVFASATERPLRYTPDHADFVIETLAGKGDFFGRPLYGANTAFRIDAGDLPEFMLYLPNRGGNLRLGMRIGGTPGGTGGQIKWLHDADRIIARYHEGSMLYEIHDAALGTTGILRLAAVPLHDTEGLILKLEKENVSDPVEIFCAFGGSDGLAGARRGDIGTENQPVTRFFQLHPENCTGNEVKIDNPSFSVKGKPGTVAGVISGDPANIKCTVSDARQWSNPAALLAAASIPTQTPLALARTPLTDTPLFISLQHDANNQPLLKSADLPQAFDAAQTSRHSVATRITIQTPDPFIDAAASALAIAADADWDESQGVVMHGAVAWRNKLLGWRGPYSLDDFGWHDRMTRQLTYWAGQQVTTEPIPIVAHADPKKNLAADDWVMLHSNGAMSKSHYDMNIPYIDYYLRHALWTGDLDLLKQTWPVLQRHLAWEQRNFRRLYGNGDQEKLPLYEAYNAIWASDNLQYDGGGVTHTSALNYYHNQMAARIATLIGQNPVPYQKEADLILKGMNRELWLPDNGIFAEFKDLLPPQSIHDDPALWTFYHTVDSQAADPFQAYQMSRYVDTSIAHIPIHGPGVPAGDYSVLASTNWMPYIWSINNVTLGENAATALAQWQANRPTRAFSTFKGNILDSMFMGICPGNCHMASYFDSYRGESQRDFADPTAMMTRALVEGLFGVHPDLLAQTITVQPGFPPDWENASITHPDFTFSFQRSGIGGNTDTFTIDPHFSKPTALHLILSARLDHLYVAKVNGQIVPWTVVDTAVGLPQVEIISPPAQEWKVEVIWSGAQLPAPPDSAPIIAAGTSAPLRFPSAELLSILDPQHLLARGVRRESPSEFSGRVANISGPHTLFARLRQGNFDWWYPLDLDVRQALEILPAATQDSDHLRFTIRNNTPQTLNAAVSIHNTMYRLLAQPNGGTTPELTLLANSFLPGTNPLSVRFPDGSRLQANLTNWRLPLPSTTSPPGKVTLDTIDCSPAFNANLADIFHTDYLSPRSPYTSLSIPKQGIGGWSNFTTNPAIDDSGLRTAAAKGGSQITLLNIPFRTPAQGKNIAFTSFWDNHPRQISLPLTGTARHLYLLMTGTTNAMRSRIQNALVQVTYADDTTADLPLVNPTNWWPIDQDYLIDDFAFSLTPGGTKDTPAPSLPPRLDLRTGQLRLPDPATFPGTGNNIPGGSALLLDLPLNPDKSLRVLTIRPSTNEVIIGLIAATLAR